MSQDAQAAHWESRLEAEGLGLMDADRARERTGSSVERLTAEGANAYLEWATGVLRAGKFASPFQRRVWELHAEGKSVAEICTAIREERPDGGPRSGRGTNRQQVRGSRRGIMRALERVKRTAPLPPVCNPWRKRGRNAPVALRSERLSALVAQVIGRLRRTAASEQELNAILETHMAQVGSQKYNRIRLTDNIPGFPMMRDMLKDVMGRPHAGGIDVSILVPEGGKQVRKRITLPWHMIKSAEVDEGATDAA